MESMIGAKSSIEGNIVVEGTLRIDGKITGAVKADSVILSESAAILGDVTVKSAIIGGRIDGNVQAQEFVEIKPSGRLFGDIHSRKLSVAEGGIFEGRSHVHRDEDASNVIDFRARESASS